MNHPIKLRVRVKAFFRSMIVLEFIVGNQFVRSGEIRIKVSAIK